MVLVTRSWFLYRVIILSCQKLYFHNLNGYIYFFFPGWGELPIIQPKSEPAWGEPAAPTSTVDNGTSAWGKSPAGVGGWGDGGHEPSGPYARSNGHTGSAPCKSGNLFAQIFCHLLKLYILNVDAYVTWEVAGDAVCQMTL